MYFSCNCGTRGHISAKSELPINMVCFDCFKFNDLYLYSVCYRSPTDTKTNGKEYKVKVFASSGEEAIKIVAKLKGLHVASTSFLIKKEM